nr:hypothetical protein [uncultured Psychroserpens sp.]
MKKRLLIALFIAICTISYSQEQPKVGDVLEINKPYAQTFNHINFPKANILIKRGKVANYNSIYGNQVVISEIKTKNDGTTYVVLKKNDGTKFFGYLNEVKANYNKSLQSGELTIIQ